MSAFERTMVSCGGTKGFMSKCIDSDSRRFSRKRAVAETVHDEKRKTLRILSQAPGIAALDFAVERDTDCAMSRAGGSSEPRHDDRAFTGHRMDVELGCKPAHRAEASARRASGGVSVTQAALDVVHAGATIDGQQLDDGSLRRPAVGSAARRRPRGEEGC